MLDRLDLFDRVSLQRRGERRESLPGQRGYTDGAAALLRSISGAGGARVWAESVAVNVKPAHTRPGAPLKAELIAMAAHLMVEHDVDTVEDLVTVVEASPVDNPIRHAWKRLPSQSSGVTCNYLLILAGLPSVKPDGMVLRFLKSALGTGSPLTTDRAVELVMAAADALHVSPRTLDHVIWRTTSGGNNQGFSEERAGGPTGFRASQQVVHNFGRPAETCRVRWSDSMLFPTRGERRRLFSRMRWLMRR